MNTDRQTELDRTLAAPMFYITLLWLVIAGSAVHLMSDEGSRYESFASYCGIVLLLLELVYIGEGVAHWLTGGKKLRQNVWYCLLPPLRLGARDHVGGQTMWLPGFGWKQADDNLATNVQLKLGYPMIGIALAILPVLGIEFVYHEKIQSNDRLGFWIKITETMIWMAFAVEFIIMISIVKKRLKFMKSHWLDLAIICLPFIAFLRVTRLGQISRLMRMKQLSKLSRTARVFRLRGLAMRAWRAILILEIVDRLMHRDPEKKLKLLQEQLAEKEEEVRELNTAIQQLQRVIEEKAADQNTATQSDPVPS